MNDELHPTAAPYAAAILAVGTDNPNHSEMAIIKSLGVDATEYRHVAFAGWCRRIAAGDPAAAIDHFRDPAREVGELDAAMSAVGWLQAVGQAQRAVRRAARH